MDYPHFHLPLYAHKSSILPLQTKNLMFFHKGPGFLTAMASDGGLPFLYLNQPKSLAIPRPRFRKEVWLSLTSPGWPWVTFTSLQTVRVFGARAQKAVWAGGMDFQECRLQVKYSCRKATHPVQ